MKISDYALEHDPLYAMSILLNNEAALKLLELGLSCKKAFPIFQVSLGFGEILIHKTSKTTLRFGNPNQHIVSWFLLHSGKMKSITDRPDHILSTFYVGLWYSEGWSNLDDEMTNVFRRASEIGDLKVDDKWIWMIFESNNISEGGLDAVFGE